MGKNVCLILILGLIVSSNLFAEEKFSQYKGYSDKDTRIAKMFYETFSGAGGVVAVEVKENIMAVHVTKDLATELLNTNKPDGKELLGSWWELFGRLSGHDTIAIWIYDNATKIIEVVNGKAGGSEIKYLQSGPKTDKLLI